VTMASPTFQQVSGLAAKRTIEATSAASEPEPQEERDMAPRRKRGEPMEPGPERDRVMIDMYQQGHSLKEIREHVGLTYDSAIYLALKNAGISPRNKYNTANNGSVADVPATVEVTADTPERINGVPVAPVSPQQGEDQGDDGQDRDDYTDTQDRDSYVPDGASVTQRYVLRVAIMQPVVESLEVEAVSFDAAYEAAKALPGLVSILGVVRSDALKGDGDA